MTTPIADRIRAKAQGLANQPTATPVGATEAIRKQAAISATGKASAPIPSGQSSIAETIAAGQTNAGLQAVAEDTQQAGEAMALQEQEQASRQAAIESNLRQKKLASDTNFVNKLKQFTSTITMNTDKVAQQHEMLKLKGELQNLRLEDEKYKQSLQEAGRTQRLQSKEDFAIAMSKQGLERGTISSDAQSKLRNYKADRQRESGRLSSLDEINTVLEKGRADAKAAEQSAIIGGVGTAAKGVIDYYGSKPKDKVTTEDPSPNTIAAFNAEGEG